MSHEYYYLISSLPSLSLTEEPRLTWDEFLGHVESHLSTSRGRDLAEISLVPEREPCCETEKKWQAWETYIRNILARLRANKTGISAESSLRPVTDVFPTMESLVEDIFSKDNPVVRERELDELRWQQLDHLQSGHSFDFDALVIYALRLQLVEKWRRCNEEEGQKTLLSLIEVGVRQATEKQSGIDNYNSA